jgi:uncharacterized RDD family membrane protein YckC
MALVYDALPVLALWLLASALVLALRGGTPVQPWTWMFWLQNLLLWAIAGGYVVSSWRRGGQTLGMRPWRLRVVDEEGRTPGLAALWQRYAWATLSLAAVGLGFLWALVEPQRRCWHDLASSTRLVRVLKPRE